MALVTEYDMTWHSGSRSGNIYIQRESGVYQFPLTLKHDSLEIQNTIPNWEDPVARSQCRFTIINDLSDWNALLPLMTIENGEYKIIVTEDTVTANLFEGFINCEAVDQDMLDWSDLTITASGLLSKLENVHPTSVDTLQYISLIDLIDDCLRLTGTESNIEVVCDLYETTVGEVVGATVFNQTSVFTELFWRNNIERTDALEILRMILHTFNCYLFWYNTKWRIFHYNNLNGDYGTVEYTTGVSYGYGDTGAVDTSSIYNSMDLWTTPFIYNLGGQQAGTQRLSVIPGLRQLDIKLDQKHFFNLFNPDLSDITVDVTAEPVLNRRQWHAYDPGAGVTWSEEGQAFQDMGNAIKRFGDPTGSGIGQLNGLQTRFPITVHWDTNLVITFKWGITDAGLLADYDSAFDDTPDKINIRFHWFLCTYEAVVANRDYFVYDEDTDIWSLVEDGDPEVDYNSFDITAADIDPDLLTYTGKITIRIHDIISDSSADVDNVELLFGMGTELVWKGVDTPKPAYVCYYGDLNAQINETPRNNILQGLVTTDFLNKKTITLDMFDEGWSYRNALVYGSSSQYLTSDWSFGSDPSVSDTLARWLMAYKFRLYRVARQVISISIYAPDLTSLWPGMCFIDSKQNDKIFALLSVIDHPESDIQQLKMYEYDNTEEINLI